MRELGEFFQNREFTPTGRLREASRMGKMRSLYLRDPDGNLVEIAEYRKGGQHAHHQSG